MENKCLGLATISRFQVIKYGAFVDLEALTKFFTNYSKFQL